MNRTARSSPVSIAWVVAFAAFGLLRAQPAAAAGQAQQIQSFGDNPTGIGMYLYTPSNVSAKPAVFVGIHACGGKGMDVCGSGTGFAQQAEKYGFLLVCPSSASSTGCWDVHSQPELTHGGGGDAAGIISMVNYVVKNKNGDPNRVYVAGHSSGGMMTNIMLGSYPDVFKAGAAFAGVPFGCFAVGPVSAGGWNSACAQGKVTMTGAGWGDTVRAAYPAFTGTRPRMQVWHGTEDATVNFANFGEEIKQWTNVLGVSATPVSTENNAIRSTWIRTRYADAAGVVRVEAIRETGQPHNLVLDIAEAVHFFGLDGSKPVPDLGSGGGGGQAAGGAAGAGAAGGGAAGSEAGSGGAQASAGAGGEAAAQNSAGAGGSPSSAGGSVSVAGGVAINSAGALAAAGEFANGSDSPQPAVDSGGCSIHGAGNTGGASSQRFGLGLLVGCAVLLRSARRRKGLAQAAPLLAAALSAQLAIGCAGSDGAPPGANGGAAATSLAGSSVASGGAGAPAVTSGGAAELGGDTAASGASGAAPTPSAGSGSGGALNDTGGSGGGAGASGAPSFGGGAVDPGTDGDGDFTVGPTYTAAPESRTSAGTPVGKVSKFTMASQNSAIYPSDIKTKQPFTRGVQVYIPYGYVPNTEVPFMVAQDGARHQGQIIPVVDNLIASKKLPAMVIILIEPGPGDGTGSERSNEYDKVSGTYATFIETEVLPKVEADYKVKFTKNPEGRGAFGGSSGGPAAFGMAWFHPELYRRVLTYSGSFVRLAPDSMYPHGAWGYHETLIPGSDQKPLRVAIACGENDNSSTNAASTFYNWVIANQNMAKVLGAKGYHYRFLYGKGAGHDDDKMIRQTLPETLLWLWRGYVAPK